MQNFIHIVLLTVLLLTVATPGCLAAENAAAGQQPASQFSKLPPLPLPSSLLTQKEYFQAALWLAQQESRQASPPRAEDEWLGLNTTKATVLSSLATLLTAIMAPVISIFIARKTMTQTKKSLEDDFNQRKLEQKENFKFQLYQLALEEKKKVMLNFFELTSLCRIRRGFSHEDLKLPMSVIELLFAGDFLTIAKELFNLLENEKNLHALRATTPENIFYDPIAVRKYEELHGKLSAEIRNILSGDKPDPA